MGVSLTGHSCVLQEVKPEVVKEEEESKDAYKKDDFFDQLSCEALERLAIAEGAAPEKPQVCMQCTGTTKKSAAHLALVAVRMHSRPRAVPGAFVHGILCHSRFYAGLWGSAALLDAPHAGTERSAGVQARTRFAEQRKVDIETFGGTGIARRNNYGRGRGRSGRRGGGRQGVRVLPLNDCTSSCLHAPVVLCKGLRSTRRQSIMIFL